ncbi:hypothetical protein HMPREF2791_10345 [Corynebacterium sp. HMSC034A01]|nr:hypothetical protein HMPREF2791_10345 [Corynebacterium sp. HMSC034A01]
MRHYLPYALVPNLALVLGLVALCFAVILIAGWSLTYFPGAVGEAWFALHGVPLLIDGVSLTAMPLLPAVGVAAVVAVQVRKATAGRVSVLDLLTLLGLALGLPLLVSAIALFMVFDASHVYSVGMPPVVAAFVYPLIVHLVGFVIGVRCVVWHALAKRSGIPTLAVDAGANGANLILRLLAAAATVFLIALAFGYSRVGELLSQFPQLGVGGAVALVVLSLLYLPNAAVAQLAVLLGGSFEAAGADVSLFANSNVAYPPLPLFAAIPAEMPQWAPVLLVVPAAVLAHAFVVKPLTLESVAATATWAALLGALLGIFSAGGAGAYGLVGTDPFAFALSLFLWIALTGALVRAVALVRQRTSARSGS